MKTFSKYINLFLKIWRNSLNKFLREHFLKNLEYNVGDYKKTKSSKNNIPKRMIIDVNKASDNERIGPNNPR